MQARRIAGHDRPVFVRFPTHAAGRQGDRRRRSGVEMFRRVLGEQEGRVEPHHGRFLYRFQGRIFELEHGELIAGRVDDVVEFRPAASLEELLDVRFDAGGRQVARVACDAAFGARVRREELVDAGVDAGLLGRGDGDRGAEFEASFGNTVAYTGAAADDEDAGAGELVAVFFAVGHDGGIWGVMMAGGEMGY